MRSIALPFMTAAFAVGVASAGQVYAADAETIVKAADSTIATLHSDITFALTAGPRRNIACGSGEDECAGRPDRVADTLFAARLRLITANLESGLRELVPGIDSIVPGSADGLFEVYVVDTDEWDTASSASGKIAISASLANAAGFDDLLAYLIAREMVHIVVAHHERNSAASIMTSLAMNIVIPGSGLVKSVVSLGGAAIAANSNREEQERRADKLATLILRASGYSTESLAYALKLFQGTPLAANWSLRLQGVANFVFASAPAANPQQELIPTRTATPPAAKREAEHAAVITYLNQGTLVTAPRADMRKVAASSPSRTGNYYDRN